MSASLTNRRIAQRLDDHAKLLEIAGENAFRARAYSRAAEAIQDLDAPVGELIAAGSLRSLPGVGEAIAESIEQLVASGTFAAHDELTAGYPESLLQLATVPGIGAKSVSRLYRDLHVATLDDLAAAADAGTIVVTKGLGNRVHKAAVAGLAQLAKRTGFLPLGVARALAGQFELAYLSARPQDRIAVAGGARRWDPLVESLAFLIATDNRDAARDAVTRLPGVESAASETDGALAVSFDDGKTAELFFTNEQSWGSALVRATGSEAHLARLGGIAPDLPDEEAVYGAAGLPWIPPELRSDAEAFDRLDDMPGLITLADIKGELHTHTTWSDGQATVRDMAAAAQARGYQFLGITDHSHSLAVANGLSQQRLSAQRDELASVSEELGFPLFAGAEVEVLSNGDLDYPDAVLARLDLVVASIHGGLRQSRGTLMERQVRTLRNPHVDILAHPSGRLLERREGGDFDWDVTFATAAETGTALEINADPARLDLDPALARRAAAAGALITINSDSHTASGFEQEAYGVAMARKAWLRPDQVLNTWEPERVRDWLRDRKR
ncbi:MAG: PHP domain-containing protein [Thermomicrobiales bacterium]